MRSWQITIHLKALRKKTLPFREKNVAWNFRYLHRRCKFKWTILNTLSTIMLGERVFFKKSFLRAVDLFFFFVSSHSLFKLLTNCFLPTGDIGDLSSLHKFTNFAHSRIGCGRCGLIYSSASRQFTFTFNMFPLSKMISCSKRLSNRYRKMSWKRASFHRTTADMLPLKIQTIEKWFHLMDSQYGCYSDQPTCFFFSTSYRNARHWFLDSVRQLI